MIQPVIAIHGGAGAMSRAAMSPEKEQEYLAALESILTAGQAVLARGGSALDAVTEAVRLLEDCPLFNAGHGAVFTSAATHELDASIMDGATLRSGAIANVNCVRNPVFLARRVMENSKHVFFVGEGAEAFAKAEGLEIVDPSYFSTEARREQLLRVQRETPDAAVLDHDGQAMVARGQPAPADPLDADKKFGTVGAVAVDAEGNLAAATSTGGITNKQVGRVGDAPMIGAGTYASNKTCAVSTTGTGEMFIRMVAAYDVAAQMEYCGASLQEAADRVVMEKLPTIGGKGGLVAVDAQGNVALPFNTEGMYRGYARVGEKPVTAIYR
ncbi:Isoaspartyl peptidase precursor [Achromobacter spanius]|jgi:beta-aspartyl-peptidase (threonine type)|uniref:Isoaspartyl peptidase n=1 Tax=Achromobacter spanius TaxID=217203 RepID=A0AA42S513_9BURK|nr:MULTISPECIES: isoaspartyl peptidase/L-asparaginase [Achromobacter]SPT37120.1 Isoaspartyl peptidase precursor [Achromobacter denitrificans]AUA59521.1 beta-aspartyl-peptidase [Achromobacter spanius]MCS3508684.1 beta-aspartyl-peptidase (threonine type) [Achromobacter sp. JUb104]MDH0737531.1 isoaspartyl peptidase/L-asparaginase [Achromobacter spanius]CAB3655453.1 Isoaspartyl peptidase [Achromobacter spanius]